jgi:hypothetical protein
VVAPILWPQEERLKVKAENPSFSICEIAKELGRRWAEMAPEIKQRYQQVGPRVDFLKQFRPKTFSDKFVTD